jgi:hypothetical protein
MHRRWTGLLTIVLAAGIAGNLAAQQGVALTPFIGYSSPSGNLVERNNSSCCMTLEPKGGIMVGAIGELSLAKQFGLSLFAASTVGLTQKANFDFSSGGGSNLQLGMATTQFGGSLIIRPLGRSPNGAPKGFYLEGGAAYQLLSFSDVADRSSTSTASPSWNSSTVAALFGGGLVFRVGPRASMTIFGRYIMPLSEYSSDGLDDWNSVPCGSGPCPDTPKKVSSIFVGVGLRTGR